MTANPNATLSPEPQIGRRLDRLESVAKVTGAADYTHNLELPRMLHAKVVRSPHAHARILGIDTREAAAMPGVVHVVTAREVMRLIPDPHYGPAFHDQPILAIEKVRQFAFADEAFSIENEEMTPSMKIRRHKIRERYQERIDGLYRS